MKRQIRIAKSAYSVEEDREPHAIIFRNLRYFSTAILSDTDDLDYFEYCSFDKGNETGFDVRRYRGDPPAIVSIYLPINAGELDQIIDTVNEIILGFHLPKSSIGWKRSFELDLGRLERPPSDRLKEAEARILALKIAAQRPDRTASTNYIKNHVEEYYTLTENDKAPSTTRRREQVWQQVIGNVISHRNTNEGPFKKGYAVRTPDGLTVTDHGMDYLKSMGFEP